MLLCVVGYCSPKLDNNSCLRKQFDRSVAVYLLYWLISNCFDNVLTRAFSLFPFMIIHACPQYFPLVCVRQLEPVSWLIRSIHMPHTSNHARAFNNNNKIRLLWNYWNMMTYFSYTYMLQQWRNPLLTSISECYARPCVAVCLFVCVWGEQ